MPTILDAETATSVMQNGQDVTVDAVNCNIYEGRVAELEEFVGKKDESFKETQLFRILQKVLKKVTPLNLIDPDSEDFKPESCKTYHDITRFCHEMVVRELFSIVDTSADDVSSVRLVSGMPVEIWLLDLGGGIEGAPKYLNPEHLRSIPFNAFLKGLMSMKWPEARAFDVKGFLGAVAHTATTSEEELQKTAEKSFSFVTQRQDHGRRHRRVPYEVQEGNAGAEAREHGEDDRLHQAARHGDVQRRDYGFLHQGVLQEAPNRGIRPSGCVHHICHRQGRGHRLKALLVATLPRGKADMVQSLSNAMMRHLQLFSACCLTGSRYQQTRQRVIWG